MPASSPPTARVSLQELLAATGAKNRDLWELRARGLFPFEAHHEHRPGLRGSASSYDPRAVPYLNRLAELRGQTQDADEWVWRLWLDRADYPIDIRDWVLKQLFSARQLMEKARGQTNIAFATEIEVAMWRKAHIASRLRSRNSRTAALEWLLAWFTGRQHPGIYEMTPEGIIEPSYFDLALKITALPHDLPVVKGKVLDRDAPYWIARLQRIIKLAFKKELEQARHDWRMIDSVKRLAENVDWGKAPSLPLIDGKPEFPSWAARKAKRKRGQPTPDIVKQALFVLNSSEGQAILFCVLLIARRLFRRSPMPNLPDQWLGIVRQWLDALPKVKK